MASIAAIAPAYAKVVLTRLSPPKPTSCFTAATSLEARAIRSPVPRSAMLVGENVCMLA